MKRFADVTNEKLLEMSKNKYSQSTNKCTKFSITCFKQYLSEIRSDVELDALSKSDLADFLCKFYLALKNEKGESYKLSSLNQIKYSIRRYFLNKKIDITSDPEFAEANVVFKNVAADTKKMGFATVEHHPDISAIDCQAIVRELSDNDPIQLQLLVFFYIMIYFCRRGLENLCEMTKDHFAVKTINNIKCIVSNKTELSKNHRENEINREEGGMIAATDTLKCPVKIFESTSINYR